MSRGGPRMRRVNELLREVIADEILPRWVPKTNAAFVDYRLGALQLSAKGLTVVQRLLAGEEVSREDVGMSPAEWRELMSHLGRGSGT